jgi:hypothetical protein
MSHLSFLRLELVQDWSCGSRCFSSSISEDIEQAKKKQGECLLDTLCSFFPLRKKELLFNFYAFHL